MLELRGAPLDRLPDLRAGLVHQDAQVSQESVARTDARA